MKKLKYLLLCMLMVFVSQGVFAETKIAFVNQQKLLEKAPQAEAARNKLQKEFAKRDQALVSMQKKIKAKTDKLERDGAMMTPEELNKLKREVTYLRRDLERDKDAFKQDLSIRQNEELIKLQKVVLNTIVKIAEKDKYDLIVSDGVIYASKRIDVTDSILTELKKQYKTKK